MAFLAVQAAAGHGIGVLESVLDASRLARCPAR